MCAISGPFIALFTTESSTCEMARKTGGVFTLERRKNRPA
jgi:hypothetical protein